MPYNRKSVLWATIKEARDNGLLSLDGRQYVQYTETDFEQILEAAGVEDPTKNLDADGEPLIGAGFDWASAADPPQSGPPAGASAPRGGGASQGATPARPAQSGPRARPLAGISPQEQADHLGVPLRDLPEARAGLHFSDEPDTAIRVDSRGIVWYQDEVVKPAIPKARMRRKTRYIDPGVKEVKRLRDGGAVDEIFEVAGDEQREMTINTTVPAWQVGIYADQRFPFRIVCYNGLEAFHRADVARFYEGSKLVPPTVVETYVGQTLCYDITSVRTTMEQEYRDEVLRNRNN